MKRRIVWLKEERRKRRATARKSRATASVAPTSRYARVGLAPALSTLWRLMHTHIDGVRTYWRGMKLLVTSAPLFATASLVLLGLFRIVLLPRSTGVSCRLRHAWLIWGVLRRHSSTTRSS